MNCNVCNKEYKHAHHKNKDNVCFSCGFWEEKVEQLKTKQVVIVDGHYYVVGPNKEPSKFNGFGGRWFAYKLLAFPDKTFSTCDMWHAGTIPTHFRDKLKDNAEWIDDKKWIKVGDVECLADLV